MQPKNSRASLKAKYQRLKKRIARTIQNGQFYHYTKHRQQQLLKRLQRYHKQLLRRGQLVLPTMGLIIGATTLSQAQTFTLVTTTASPFVNVNIDTNAPFGLSNVGSNAYPSFVDIDGDGDLDAFIGEAYGNINYFENQDPSIGTAKTMPNFVLSTDSEPFGLSDVGFSSTPSFVDIDGDGDLDAFVGEELGNIFYFENQDPSTGTAKTMPTFVLSTDSEPFGLSNIGNFLTPTFVDIDNDGDMDAFIGEGDGTINYFENQDPSAGTAKTMPTFVLSTESQPFGLSNIGNFVAPTFVDIDKDGDMDAFVGGNYGTVNYFENLDNSTGTAKSMPAFVLATDSAPFGLNILEAQVVPSFADIDGDGDLDALIADLYGKINYFENTSTDSTSPAFLQAIVDVGGGSAPSFVDIDGDGDFDAFVGNDDGRFFYYENTDPTTTKTMPTFVLSTSTAPFGINIVGSKGVKPAFVDVDGDGDMDAFIGDKTSISFFENQDPSIGTAKTMPTFVLSTSTNPFGLLPSPSNYSAPTFVDIDGDGDFDAFIGGQSGQIAYFENQDPSVGAAKTMPTFVLSTDSAPFGLSDIGFDIVPTFVDIDFDGDFDAFVGEYSGTTRYFENQDPSTGTAKTMPNFILSANTQPFGLSNVGFSPAPTIVDIDGDNFFEAIVGNFEGQLIYFESDIVLPVELVFFKAKAQKDQVLLQWQTASELDNQGFYIERSQDAKTWESLGFVKGAGTTTASQSYSFTDKAPIAGDNYYRLKQIDFDSGFEYSAIEVVQLLNQAVALNIFPIPTKEILYYRTDQMGKITSVQLHDLLGRLVLNTTTFDGELDLSMLPKGQYVLTIEGLGASIHRIVQKQ